MIKFMKIYTDILVYINFNYASIVIILFAGMAKV